ncbi:hypothetical protein CC85DRAFT_325006 [Cutaneotrichosporon oleaginosum]|uniref:FHF complex subunit HOOK-interacting protein C-terminal domain-containing protein n=1 Tax=Cutaneotrichosporon oleaginosum TaxID=879819 RepID=A0A0J0XYV4_9TREE|nr:uncharacterized protein CC85DRAFT_325006 [Cutaneotrichosporon oleaginosum]KLT46211.1 hypothetical protein CC85DRAFT_325006 [Cutaneotrichosporon oleaginosum]TXT10218.1 hypothetical protein COLE_04152 [Cutaneotrichosporon oleaginosum]
MEVSTFFTRLLQAPKPAAGPRPDALPDFDAAWSAVVATLTAPDERQLARGIAHSPVPRALKHITDALVYESNRTDEDTTGACLEYFLRHDMLAALERLCERDRPRGVKAEVLRMVNNLVVLMPERFLVHNAVHRPLRRLLRSCVGETETLDGAARAFGAAAAADDHHPDDLDDDLVDLMCILCSRMRAYPPLLLIFFHDRGWLIPHHSSGAPPSPAPPRSPLPASPPQVRTTLPSTPPRSSSLSTHLTSRALSPTPRSPSQISRALSPPLERALSPPHGRAPTPTGRSTPTYRSSVLTTDPASDAASAASAGRREADATHFEYLLFSYLLRFVHRDGRIGDFARAGLLFLFDIAFLSRDDDGGDTLTGTPGPDGSDPLQDARDALAEYILDGDFADVMAAGLGATYSLLPNKLRVPTLAEQGDDDATLNGGMILGKTADEDLDDDLLLSTDEEVHAQLDLLLKLFGFLGDIMYRCRAASLRADPNARTVSTTEVLGPAVADATLDALQTAFVDNVLYPSILECSSTDGSAVAVLTYLDVILSSLEDGPVLQRILNVLMDANAAVPVFTSPRKRKARKTGAMDFMPSIVKLGYYTDERFTLRDLILDNVKSTCPASQTAALHLLQALLSDHCRYIAPSLLSVVRMPSATALARPSLPPSEHSSPAPSFTDTVPSTLPVPVNSTDVHLQEDELYGALVPRLDDAVQENTEASGLGSYVTDAHNFLEADGCWRASRVPLQFVSDDGTPVLIRVGEYELDPFQHALSPSDPMVHALLDALAAWFTHPADTNIALTGALSALVRCPHRSLAGWLLYDFDEDVWAKPVSEIDDGASDTSFDAAPSRAPSRAEADEPRHHTLPALYQVLRELVRHSGRFRAAVSGFDRLLSERRQGLLFADHLEEAMSAMLEDVVTPASASSPGFLGIASPFASPFGERKKSVSLATSLRSFWSPRKSRPTTPTATPTPPTPPTPSPATLPPSPQRPPPLRAHTLPATPPRTSSLPPAPDTPFASHYAAAAVAVEVEAVDVRQDGPWRRATPVEIEDVFADRQEEQGNREQQEKRKDKPTATTLSGVLDNMIVLEELIKELVGVIVARRALGIDQVGFVARRSAQVA